MKTKFLLIATLLLVTCRLSLHAAVITNDTVINANDTGYDHQPIVISNCVVAIDGQHTFESLRIATGATLTHSASATGTINIVNSQSDEPQTLVGTNAATLANSNVVLSSVIVRDFSGSITYSSATDYLLSATNSITTLARTDTSSIPDGGTVLVSYDYVISTTNAGLNLMLVGGLEIEPGATINADGRGFGGNAGTGNGGEAGSPQSGAGAGYGGIGGLSSSNAPGGAVYGTLYTPADLGSGGGAGWGGVGGAGGGSIRVSAGGNAILNGVITANGQNGTNSRSGGGSGGSIWLTAQTVSGTGTVLANGGGGEPIHGGGGGGGRITFEFQTNSFAGRISACGGSGWQAGGAGTIFMKPALTAGQVTLDNASAPGALTVLQFTNQPDLIVQGKAVAAASSSLTFGNLFVRSNSSFTSTFTGNVNLTLTMAGNAVIEPTAMINLDGAGFAQNSGPGAGAPANQAGSGAGHGGYGGSVSNAPGGTSYDSLSAPNTAGSGGRSPVNSSAYSGGAGGGAVHLTVAGNLQLDGRVSADGTAGTGTLGGGASGGSIWLALGGLSGSGVISANGGSGGLPSGGGGAGGRIAVTYASNSFTGVIMAKGGAGYVAGGAGTIYTRANTAAYADLRADNGGIVGTNTALDVGAQYNIIVTNGASLRPTILSLTLGNLTVASNSSFLLGGSSQVTVTVNSNLTVASGGIVSGDGLGYPGGQGPGPGIGSFSGAGGGGHGGYGGRGVTVNGGTAYDSTALPTIPGSGGGASISFGGGSGGGAFRLNVSGTALVNGRISANGSSTFTNSNGGGAGGAVWLSLNQFSGSGLISADGGGANFPTLGSGGGGGGGRIAVTYNSNSFTGMFSAKGGNGFVPGGAGTVYLKANNSSLGSVTVDNGALTGTNTSFDISLDNLTIGSGATLRVASGPGGITVRNLIVQSNGTFLTVGGSLTVTSNATVALGGKISADGQTTAQTGSGSSSSVGSGGGGHGGFGGYGAGLDQTGRGGGASDSASGPTQGGGSGGSIGGAGISVFGAGGGIVRLTVTGLLNVLGSISANGFSISTNNAGGGAGGSVWLTVGGLAGNGSISADGGSGHLPSGGGGGGGRVAIYYGSNSFTGPITAKGGAGYVGGGAGTVYLKANTNSTAAVIVDNAGLRGSNTLVAATGPFDLTMQNGAISASVTLSGPIFSTPRDLLIRSNAVLKQEGPLTITRNATIEAGGVINLDGLGTGGTGAGYQSTNPRGGGGHGGYGALNPSSFGSVYGSALAPTNNGSVGGNGSGTSLTPFGGTGGAAIHLTVSNTLLLNGSISVNGLNGDVNSGGGSGGSVWLTVGTFSGNGSVSARGGNGGGSAGGGGGGRIAITYTSNLFTGPILVCAGTGAASGGAGTIYLRNNASPSGALLLDNCGLLGTNTPLSQTIGLATNISVSGGAVAEMQGPLPAFSNLLISTAGTVTCRAINTNLYLGILDSLVIDSSSSLNLDAKGLAIATGPGAGGSASNKGSGAGYGGTGGNSGGGAPGGVTYGSNTQPVDRGSGGGLGFGTPTGSQGGGALRLSVAGNLIVNGRLTANGATGVQDDSGGGSGGSLWIMANKLTGGGSINADGGGGEMFGGGGGGGGRVALISPMNTFTGAVSAAGGPGAFPGSAGSIYTSSTLLPFSVLSHSPTGTVSNTVSQLALTFSAPVNPSSANGGNLKIFNPSGQLAGSDLAFSSVAADTLLVTFPTQNLVGNYRIEAGPGIQDLLGQPTSQVYTGLFTVILPTISGTITNTNSQPIAGVLLQPSGGLIAAVTDATGTYNLGVPQGWNGTVTPSLAGSMFIPGSRSYTNVIANLSNENYLLVPTIAASIQLSASSTNLSFTWQGYAGVTYQMYYSTNLSDWIPLSSSLPGTNGPMQFSVPTDSQPQEFFRISSQN